MPKIIKNGKQYGGVPSADYTSEVSDITLYAAYWNSTTGIYTITDNRITSDTVQEFLPAVGITDSQLEALQGANIADGGQDAGHAYLKAYGGVPSIDIPIRIVFNVGLKTREVEQQKQEIYSENETVIGTWIDGKPIYRRVVTYSGNLSGSSMVITNSIKSTDVGTVVKMGGTILNEGGNWMTIPRAASNATAYFFDINLISSGLEINYNSSYNNANLFIVIEYTKTTD